MMAFMRLFELWLALAVSSRSTSHTADALSSVRLHFVRIGHRAGNGCSAWAASPRRLVRNNCRLGNGRLCMSDSSTSAASASQTTIPSTSSPSWSKLTVPQLKSQLKLLNLPVSGVKAELIRRIEEHQQESSSSSSSAKEHTENNSERPIIATHERENNQPTTTNGTRRSISFPPPKDETEVRVLEKEVHETVRMLDGLKFGGGSPAEPVNTDLQQRQLSRQQKQEKELMGSLKQSLKRSQQTKSTTPSNTAATSTPPSPDQSAHAETLEQHVEQLRLRPADALKAELSSLRLSTKGRKPDLVDRLARHYVSMDADGYGDEEEDDEEYATEIEIPALKTPSSSGSDGPVSFAGIPRLSAAAADALHRAFGGETTSLEPTPIQAAAVPKIFHPPNPSALLHAPTGSGKTIAYLLPITETLWREVDDSGSSGDVDPDDMANGMALVLLPTRELAAQVAGVATVLAPPGTVRLVPRPTDLMGFWKDSVDRGEEYEYFENEGHKGDEDESSNGTGGRKYHPRILVGSAKSVSASLFGDGKMPGTPTSKPEGKKLLGSVRWLVMDEADRLLNVKKGRTDKKSRRHEKPAAMLAAAVARLTLGRVQVVAASATVGRPLRRELSRVLGLHSSECPETIRGEEDAARMERREKNDDEKHVGRAVRIPSTVRNYVLPVDGSTVGSLLTSAAFACKTILSLPSQDSEEASSRRVLLVLTRNCDIKVHNALGALRHFGIRPEPQSLIDALGADGTDRLVEAHRKVSGVEGVGGARQRNIRRSDENAADAEDEGYLLVTHEDNVRGLHLDGLDAVVVVGRPGSPDEYTHIAGRTGRAGRRGSVLNVVGYEQAAALSSWTKMLGVDFLPVDEGEVGGILEE